LLIAQPYSPQLFRQGVLPGPHLLLQVLQGTLSTAEAKKVWKKHEKDSGKPRKDEGTWLEAMPIPCRSCTDLNGGVEVTKPLKAFSTAVQRTALWTVLRQGQDLCCLRCQHRLQWQTRYNKDVIPCDGCNNVKARKDFSPEAQRLWEALSDDILLCRHCSGEGKQKREDDRVVFCHGVCQRDLPEYHFEEKMLVDWVATQRLLAAKCTRCLVKDMDLPKETEFDCKRCMQSKHITAFGPAQLKQWLGKQRTEHRWTCYECLFPACCLCETATRPLYPVSHNSLVEGRYYCMDHRYPPCRGCGQRRADPGGRSRFKEYLCDKCRKEAEGIPCSGCGKRTPRNEFAADVKK